MLTRIVKLTIDPAKKEEFIQVFVSNKENIKSFPGCNHLVLLQDHRFDNVFFTYSKWENTEAIQNYRNSELFEGIWKVAKSTFCAAPEAWSTDELFEV